MQRFWYISSNDQIMGPLTTEQVRGKLSGGELKISDLTFREGETRWQLVSERSDFRDLFDKAELISIEGLYFRQWIVLRTDANGVKGKNEGPYSDEELIAKIQKREFRREDFLWRPGFSHWARIGDLIDYREGKMCLLTPEDLAKRAPPVVPTLPDEPKEKLLEKVEILQLGAKPMEALKPEGVSGGDLAAPGWEKAISPVEVETAPQESGTKTGIEEPTGKTDTKHIYDRYVNRTTQTRHALSILTRSALVVILIGGAIVLFPKQRLNQLVSPFRLVPKAPEPSAPKVVTPTFENAEVSQILDAVQMGEKLLTDLQNQSNQLNWSSTAGTKYTMEWMRQLRTGIRDIEGKVDLQSGYADEWYETLKMFQALQNQASEYFNRNGSPSATLRSDFMSLEKRLRGLLAQPPRPRASPTPQKQEI